MSATSTPSAPSPAKPADKEISPLTPELLFAITELAKCGLSYLKQIVSNPDFKIDLPDRAEAADKERHLRILANSAGPAAVKHFDLMCQYVFDSSKDSKGVCHA